MMPFEAHTKKLRIALLLVFCILFVATALYIVFAPGALDRYPRFGGLFYIAALVGIPFFTLAFVVLLRMFFSSAVQVRIDGRGVYWKRWSEDVIPWSSILDGWTFTVVNQHSLCLSLRDPARYPGRNPLLRAAARANKGMGAGDVAITVQGLDMSHEQLMAAFHTWRAAVGGR